MYKTWGVTPIYIWEGPPPPGISLSGFFYYKRMRGVDERSTCEGQRDTEEECI